MQYTNCENCYRFDKNCSEYISFSEEDDKCLYHRYREKEYGDLFKWNVEKGKLERLIDGDLGD